MDPRPANQTVIPLTDAWKNGLQPGAIGWRLRVTLSRSATRGINGAVRAEMEVLNGENVSVATTVQVAEDYQSGPGMLLDWDPIRLLGFRALERGATPTLLVPIAPDGAQLDYANLGRTFSRRPSDGALMEQQRNDWTPLSDIGPGRRLIANEPHITRLVNLITAFRLWYLQGGPRLERKAAEEKRLGRAEKLVELRPGSGLMQGRDLLIYQGPNDRPILVEWFPDSGTDTVRVTLPNAGAMAPTDGGERADHVELFEVSQLLASLAASQYVSADGTYVTRNASTQTPTAVLHREVKLDIVNAWNAKQRSASTQSFPMRVTLEKASEELVYTAYATVTVERRLSGKHKGVPLLSVTVNPADYRTSSTWVPELFPRRPGAAARLPYTYGPYSLQQVMAGTSPLNKPRRWEMTYRKGGRMGGYLEYTGWQVSEADVQRILVALDRRQEMGLSG